MATAVKWCMTMAASGGVQNVVNRNLLQLFRFSIASYLQWQCFECLYDTIDCILNENEGGLQYVALLPLIISLSNNVWSILSQTHHLPLSPAVLTMWLPFLGQQANPPFKFHHLGLLQAKCIHPTTAPYFKAPSQGRTPFVYTCALSDGTILLGRVSSKQYWNVA